MKKICILFTTVILMMLFAVSANALEPTGQCGDNVYWSYDEGTGELVISGEGEMKNYGGNGSPFFRSEIKTAIVEESVTSIGSYAFLHCQSLKNVKISDSVTSIGDGAFESCANLTSVAVPDSVTEIGHFIVDGRYTDLIISENHPTYKMIEGNLYSKDGSILKCMYANDPVIRIPEYVTEIDDGAIDSDHSFLQSIGRAYSYVVIIPETVKSMRTSKAFGWMGKTTAIIYEGTIDNWLNVDPMFYKDYWPINNSRLNEFLVYCIDKKLEIDKNPTCTQKGYYSVDCVPISGQDYGLNTNDGYPNSFQIPVDALGHKDDNKDYKCDNGCGYEFEKPAPEDPSKDCSCNCHKGGFMGLIWKIINFFNKLFKSNQICSCGANHW